MNITYGSVCSGIEAASTAWESLGFRPEWFSEIEAFPSAVLAHHWPQVTNLGDMTKIAERIRSGEIAAPDVLVGGTPCQAFSVAGARKGLADDRGQLTISYGELADAIDDTRTAAGKQPAIIVWENVPGVLSSKDNAFGAFLGLLAGEDCELQPPGKKWTNAGFVSGPKRTIAWRVLDAQYFGVAQRRRRVFVVASARTDFDPKKVLFESEGVRRDTPPSRSAGAEFAADAGSRVKVGSHWDSGLNPHPTLNQSHNTGGIGASNQELFSQRGCGIVGAYRMTAFGQYADDETASTCKARDYKDATDLAVCVTGNMTHTLKAEGFDGSEDGTGRGTPIVNTFSSTGQVHGLPVDPPCVAFNSKDHGQDAAEEISPTLRAAGHGDSHANAGAPPAVAYGFQPRIARNGRGDMGDVCHALTAEAGETGKGDSAPHVAYCLQHAQIGRRDSAGPQGKGWQEEVGFTLDSRSAADAVAVAFAENSRAEVRLEGGDGQVVGALSAGGGKPGQGYPTAMVNMAVRRLTPVECERLQGFPDNHTLIPIAKLNKLIADELAYLREHFPDMPEEEAHRLAADGPRYKAIGNSMAVPCMEWIGMRILMQLEGAM